jgi:hypothetical protein
VVTGWTVVGGSTHGRYEQRLQVFRRVDGPVDSFLAVAESSAEVAPDDPRHFFKTRIPVESGDLFALRGTTKTFVCDGAAGVTSGLHEGPTPIGASYAFKAEEGLGVPLDVAIEPDEDRDGYGDQTQDHCTRAARTQNDCPAIKLRVDGITVGKHSIHLDLEARTKAQARVEARIIYPFDPPGPGSDGMAIALIQSGVKALLPGRSARVGIRLPKEVRRRLAELRRRQSLKARMTVYAFSVAGRSVDRELTVRLPGQKGT